jgi:signal peptidase I
MTGVDLATLLEGRPIEVPAEGGSMWPAIHNGDVVRVSAIGDRPLRCGDVVLSVSGQRLILHRVTHVGQHVITHGDTMLYPDAALRPVQVLGRATECLRDGTAHRISTRPYSASLSPPSRGRLGKTSA